MEERQRLGLLFNHLVKAQMDKIDTWRRLWGDSQAESVGDNLALSPEQRAVKAIGITIDTTKSLLLGV